jgi:hypothetical protein
MESHKNALDISKMWLQYPHNARDEHGNTFWHQLARGSEHFEDWSEVVRIENRFKQRHKHWTPNPFIENNNNKTAYKEAEAVFKRSKNPVVGLLVVYLKQKEESFLQKFAVKEYRDAMPTAQYIDYELVECLPPDQVISMVAAHGTQQKRPERPWQRKWR